KISAVFQPHSRSVHMKRTSLALATTFLLAVAPAFGPRAVAQEEVDRQLAEEIFKIRAIDNHAHPLRATREGEDDREFDALIPDTLEPSPLPVRLRPDNPEYVGAWREFWGYRHDDMSEAHAREVREARRRVMNERGDAYPAWVLDKLNIEVMFANRVALGRGLTPERFRWVAFDDALILPLSSSAVRKIHPDYAAFYPGEDALLKRYLSDLHMASVPPTLREYTARVVTPTLESQRRAGAVAVKFEAAYLRALVFTDPSLRKTNFVLIHGGWPFADQAAALLLKPNVYADFSAQTFLRTPHALAQTLRGWLELAPEKVMFATDAFVLTPEIGWEEVGWLSNRTGRDALAVALTGMMRDGEITRARASELAHMVMRDNAARLYGI